MDPTEPSSTPPVVANTMPAARQRRLPAGLRLGLAIGGGILGVLILGLLIVGFAVDLGGFARAQIVAQAPLIQQKLGRSVRIGSISLRLLPQTRLVVRDVEIEAEPGQSGVAAQPLLHIGTVRAKLAVWPLLSSLGKRIDVLQFEVSDFRVQVIKNADGSLSYADILDHLANQPESPPMTQDAIDRLAGFTLHQASLEDGAVIFHDLTSATSAAVPLKIDDIDLTLSPFRLFEQFTVDLKLAAFASAQNLHVSTTLGPLPRDLQVTQPVALLRKLSVSIRPFQLEPLLRFLPRSPGVGMQRATVEAELTVENPVPISRLAVVGKIAAKSLVLSEGLGTAATDRGEPVDVKIDTQLSAVVLAGDVKIDRLNIDINDMAIRTQADLRSLLTTPAIHTLQVNSQGLKLERLLALLPHSSQPKDASLTGPLEVRGSASGTPTAAQVQIAVDLTAASLLLPSVRKPAGTPLTVELLGKLLGPGQGLAIDRFGLILGPLALVAKGHVRSGDDIDLLLDTGSVDLEKLFAFVPSVQKSLTKKTRIDGDLTLKAHFKKHKDTLDVRADAKMSSAKLDQGDLDLRGDAVLSAHVQTSPGTASLEADLDLTGTQLKIPGSVDKDDGVPMRVRADVQKTGKIVQVKLAELTLPGGQVRVNGRADLGGNSLDLKIPLVDLDLRKLSSVLPMLKEGSLNGLLDSKVRFALAADGNPNRLSTVRCKLSGFDMSVAGGSIKGDAEVVGADQPRKITFDFVGRSLNLDKILGPPKPDGGDTQPKHEGGGTEVPRWVRHLDLNGKLDVDSGTYRGNTVRDFLLELVMTDGKLLMKSMRGQALGGNIVASGSTIDFGPSRPKFSLRAKLDRVDVGEILALKGGDMARKLSGKGSVDLSADGNGLAWSDISQKVTGVLGLSIADGRLQGASLGTQVVAPLLSHLNQGLATTLSGKDLVLRDLQGQFQIQNGKLATKGPLRFAAEEGAVSLSGDIGLDKSLSLLGNMELTPKTIAMATGGRVVINNNIPVSILMRGTLTNPQFQLVDVARTAGALLVAALKGKGGDLLQNKAGDLGRGVLDKVNIPGGKTLPGVLGGAGDSQPGTPTLPLPIPTQLPQATPGQPTPAQQTVDRLRKSGLGGLLGR